MPIVIAGNYGDRGRRRRCRWLNAFAIQEAVVRRFSLCDFKNSKSVNVSECLKQVNDDVARDGENGVDTLNIVDICESRRPETKWNDCRGGSYNDAPKNRNICKES